jgi:hypothetical protein
MGAKVREFGAAASIAAVVKDGAKKQYVTSAGGLSADIAEAHLFVFPGDAIAVAEAIGGWESADTEEVGA